MLYRSLLGLSLASLVIAACSDTTRPNATAPEAGPICPGDARKAQGSTCTQNGYSCAVGYLCPGDVWQQQACTCTMGKYACKDATGQDVDPAMGPQCAATPPPTEKCGASVTDMDNKDCGTAGFACYFKGATCAGQTQPNTDVCICAPRQGASSDGSVKAGLAWNCEIRACQ